MNIDLSTYCHFVWNGITIDRFGDIYSCCYRKPEKLGNLHEGDLESAINGIKIKEYRQQAISGKLSCFTGCTLVPAVDKNNTHFSALDITYSDLQTLHISCSEDCNIRCIMCDHPVNHEKNKTELPFSLLKQRVNFDPFEEIIIQGGEPLHVKSCRELTDYLGKINKKYTLLTNGLLITKSNAATIARDARIVSISFNAATKQTHERVNRGSSFEQVLENIHYLREAREKTGSSVLINGRMTLIPQNLHEIPLFIQNYVNFGFDRINFGFDKRTVPRYLNNNPSFTKTLRAGITEQLGKASMQDIDDKRLQQLDLMGG